MSQEHRVGANSRCPTSGCPRDWTPRVHKFSVSNLGTPCGCKFTVSYVTFFVFNFFGLNWGELPSVLCCARILVCAFGFAMQINLWGAVGVSLFRVWLTWEETPCQVRDCCKYLCVEGYHKDSLCGLCLDMQSPADWVDSWGDPSQKVSLVVI